MKIKLIFTKCIIGSSARQDSRTYCLRREPISAAFLV